MPCVRRPAALSLAAAGRARALEGTVRLTASRITQRPYPAADPGPTARRRAGDPDRPRPHRHGREPLAPRGRHRHCAWSGPPNPTWSPAIWATCPWRYTPPPTCWTVMAPPPRPMRCCSLPFVGFDRSDTDPAADGEPWRAPASARIFPSAATINWSIGCWSARALASAECRGVIGDADPVVTAP